MRHRKLAATGLLALGALTIGLMVEGRWISTYKNGLQAYLFGYPLVISGLTRDVMTAPHPAGGLFAATNDLYHVPAFPTPDMTQVVAPNADTLYSIAWLDLAAEPVVLHVPNTGGRWYMMELLDAWTEDFGSIGKRMTGTEAGDYAIVGPSWSGVLPPGVQEVRAPTNMVWIIGRTWTRNPADYEAVHAVQRQYRLAPLSRYGLADQPAGAPLPSAADIVTPPVVQIGSMDAQLFFSRLAALMKGNAPHPDDAPMIAKLAKLGIEPGKPFTPDAETKAALDSAVWTARALFDAKSPGTQGPIEKTAIEKAGFDAVVKGAVKLALPTVNHWSMSLNLGRYGTNYTRRALTALVGLGANVAEDAVYALTHTDADDRKLTGTQRYILHFDKSDLPPAQAFWSLTLYNDQMFFVPNELDRYALGDRDPMIFGADGSLDIYIQHDRPDPSHVANWLPAPADDFNLILRLYDPERPVLDGTWKPPAVSRSEER